MADHQTSDPTKEEKRTCRCPLCGEIIVANNQEECIEHMSNCKAFASVHPGDGLPTNMEYFSNAMSEQKCAKGEQKCAPSDPIPEKEERRADSVDAVSCLQTVTERSLPSVESISRARELERAERDAGKKFTWSVSNDEVSVFKATH